MDLSVFQNTPFALLVVNVDSDEDDMRLVVGNATWNGSSFLFAPPDLSPLELPEDVYVRIKEVTPDVQNIFGENVKYFVMMSMGSLPDDNPNGYENTGLKWT
ncbi:hypothetical protein JNM05_16520 [bacterium]|nr:hypothetical protein [bacterium]